jgi:lipoprotein-releasing system permease protein
MYKLHLILKYLRKRRIAWVSLIAVILCTTMVLVVNSVMGGWLRMFRESFHGITGDVIVKGDLWGFPDYEEIIRRIGKLPETKAAVPVIRTFGLLSIPRRGRFAVQVFGYPPNIGEVNNFPESLHRLKGEKNIGFGLWPDVKYTPPVGYQGGKDVRTWKGMIVGGGVIGIKKGQDGELARDPEIYRMVADLTVLPISRSGSKLDTSAPAPREFFWIVDDSRTKVSFSDSSTVYVGFDELQSLLSMTAEEGERARTSEIHVALKEGEDVRAARGKIEQIVGDVAQEKGWMFRYSIPDALTWEQINQTYLGAIEKEKGLTTILFAIISLVAIFLIFCIFYMIVVEKTRDIGVIKSVGATSGGVAGIFLGYGLALGMVGGGLGLLAAWLIVHYINQIHDFISRHGVTVWDPDVYLFDNIPNTMNPREASIIVAAAVIASVLGALVPAIRAARMNPVEALRWE